MKKFYVESFGCKFNKAETELIKKILTQKYKEASEKEADFIIFNTCGVVEKTERKIFKKAKQLQKKGKKIIFAGCLPLISPKICQEIGDGVLGPTNILDLPKVIESILKGKKAVVLAKNSIDKAKLGCFTIPRESCVAIVPISEGCLSFCAFCATKFARGRLRSFDQEAILENIKKVLNLGAKEIQLTSQDLAIYGKDKGKWALPELLTKISEIKGDFKVRLGMMNPWGAKKIFSKLLKILENEKFYKFLHLPLQSGSDRILKLMNRNYKAKDFFELVSKFKKKFKNSLLATDVIVGFPTETEKDFQKTVFAIKKAKPEILHIFRYSRRPQTEASKLKDFPDRIKKERSRFLTKIFLEICQKENRKYLRKKFKALITEKRGNSFLARLPSYKAVIVKEGNLGDFVEVEIVEAKPNYLIGKLIDYWKTD
ncbi:tRNA (N(6)-L-threonylcarbamoyladenosine(37)-C(2))-methylthiotransferase [Candidatus Parcubacteria bacterium]|nr:tRNA (N(6)-L-threonylcarbamoyladenosine(37)-C(2))-methylthiotransferase [Candidatus Parcubacteria bacterium]